MAEFNSLMRNKSTDDVTSSNKTLPLSTVFFGVKNSEIAGGSQTLKVVSASHRTSSVREIARYFELRNIGPRRCYLSREMKFTGKNGAMPVRRQSAHFHDRAQFIRVYEAVSRR